VAPAAAAFAMGFRSPVDQLILTFYVLCGLTRLARFNVTVAMLPKDATGKSKYFEGTPIPFACLTTLTMEILLTSGGWIHEKLPYGLLLEGTPVEVHACTALFLLMACLMVSKTLHVPKP
jgi:CDP-diacylglycerol---serine O-phosphatidyltransferase